MIQFRHGTSHRGPDSRSCGRANPRRNPRRGSSDGLSSGDEEDPILAEEASENDSDCDKFIHRIFGFLKPHIRRHKKDTPASVSISLKLDSD